MTQLQSSSGDFAMKSLLIVTAATELGAGLALILSSSTSIVFISGAPLETSAALTICRICGAALLALGVACWLARNDTQSRAAGGLVVAMLIYDVGTAGFLAYAGFNNEMRGVGLWPGVVLHSIMTIWCVLCLRRTSIVR